jgi:serine/threonine protein kinase
VFLVPQPNGRVLAKLIDFGIAYDPRTSDPVIAGTPEYMAPETLFARRAPDARIDVYALAVVAYECLTGHRPFAGADIEAVRALIAREAPPVTDFRADLDLGVDVWMVRALHRDPHRRYQSAKALVQGLSAVATPLPLAA